MCWVETVEVKVVMAISWLVVDVSVCCTIVFQHDAQVQKVASLYRLVLESYIFQVFSCKDNGWIHSIEQQKKLVFAYVPW